MSSICLYPNRNIGLGFDIWNTLKWYNIRDQQYITEVISLKDSAYKQSKKESVYECESVLVFSI